MAECRGATRRALENLVELALAEKVAFVVIVGDLYDGDWPDYNTGLFFGKQMARLRDGSIPVVMIRGNHDAANKMTKDLRLVDNVTVLSTHEAQTVLLEDHGVAIHGRSFADPRRKRQPARSYPPRRGGYFNLGLLHTCVDGREGHEPYAPCTLADLRAREYGYWALGHIHRREVLHEGIPGSSSRGTSRAGIAREPGPKGCVLVTVDDHHEVISAEPRWLDVVRWETCRLDATGARDGDEAVARFGNRLPPFLSGCDGRLLALRVEVARGRAGPRGAGGPRPTGRSNSARLPSTPATAGSGSRRSCSGPRRRGAWPRASPATPPSPSSPPTSTNSAGRGPAHRAGHRALDDLVRKLPSDLLDGFDSPPRLRGLLDQVGPMLFERLVRS